MEKIQHLKGAKVHTRQITIETWTAPDGIIVEGRLKDDRLADTYALSGQPRPPGTVHHMILAMHVTGPPLTVVAVDVRLPGIPYEDCRETAASLQAIVGMPIVAGFTTAVKHRLGGVHGCAHLTTLLLAMAPAAVQGFWAAAATDARAVRAASMTVMESYLVDTCRVWRRDGPRAAALREATAAGEVPGPPKI
jgi:hypothetical protein